MRRGGNLTKEERRWLNNTRILIVDGGTPWRNFTDLDERNQNDVGRALLRTYRYDLKFPRPRYFTIRPWLERGIDVAKVDKTLWRKIRILSTMRERRVFVLWGQRATRQARWIEPNMGHLIVHGGYPGTNKQYNYFCKTKPFSTVADWLGITREIWRL